MLSFRFRSSSPFFCHSSFSPIKEKGFSFDLQAKLKVLMVTPYCFHIIASIKRQFLLPIKGKLRISS
jgi:hypothetical protein